MKVRLKDRRSESLHQRSLIHNSVDQQAKDHKKIANRWYFLFYSAIHTDTTGLKTYKSKSEYQSKEKMVSHKSIDVKKIVRPSVKTISKNKNER